METSSRSICRFRRLVPPLVLALLAVLGVGSCSSDKPTTPVSGQIEMFAVWGDSQAGVVKTDLQADLIVKIGVREGLGVRDVAVHFETLSGSTSITPSVVTTDANGLARARVTLGTSAGEYAIQATAEGYPPVVFTGVAVPPVITSYTKSVGNITFTWHHSPADGFRCLSVLRMGNADLLSWTADTLVLDSTGADTVFTDTGLTSDGRYAYRFDLEYGENYHISAASILVDDSMSVDLPEDVYDLAFDPVRRRLYAAVPLDRSVTTISLEHFAIEKRVAFAGLPYNICFSSSGDVIYFPSWARGQLVILNVDNWSARALETGTLASSPNPRDVLEYRPGQVLVVSDFGQGTGLVYFLKYLRGPTETLSRIPNTGLFNTYNEEVQLSADSCSIFMIRKPDTGLVVAKFTITDDSLPVAAARYLDVSFPTVPFNFGVSHATGLIYLPNGLVLDSADLSTVGNTGIFGQVALSADGSLLYASHHVPGSGVDSLGIFDASTLQLRRSLPLPNGTRAIWTSPLDPEILYIAGSRNLRAVRIGS